MTVLALAREEPEAEGPRDVTGELFARFEALERVFAEQTEILREQSAQLAAHEADLLTRETGLRGEVDRLEQEQLIWGEAARESRAALDERQEAIEAKESELRALESSTASTAAELELREAGLNDRETELAGREERLAEAEADLERRVSDALAALGAAAPKKKK